MDQWDRPHPEDFHLHSLDCQKLQDCRKDQKDQVDQEAQADRVDPADQARQVDQGGRVAHSQVGYLDQEDLGDLEDHLGLVDQVAQEDHLDQVG